MEHPRLKTLNLNTNSLGNLDTMSTCAFTNLEVLELRNNGLETLVVSFFGENKETTFRVIIIFILGYRSSAKSEKVVHRSKSH